MIKKLLAAWKVEDKENWIWVAIFQTLVKSDDKFFKQVINGGSSMTVISQATIVYKSKLNHIHSFTISLGWTKLPFQ